MNDFWNDVLTDDRTIIYKGEAYFKYLDAKDVGGTPGYNDKWFEIEKTDGSIIKTHLIHKGRVPEEYNIKDTVIRKTEISLK